MSIIEMNVPELAESITEVTLAEWLVEDGDVVRMDQPICEMETDKASQELFAEQAGRITLKAEAGDDLSIGALICTIDTSVAPEEDAPSKPANESASSETSDEDPAADEPSSAFEPTGETIEMTVPELAESITEVTLAARLVEDGEIVAMDQPVCEMETDKASQELFAEKAGRVSWVAEEGADLKVGDPILTIEVGTGGQPARSTSRGGGSAASGADTSSSEQTTEPTPSETSSAPTGGHPSPAAAKMIRENDLDAGRIQGSGMGGRITKADVLTAIEEGTATVQQGFSALRDQPAAFSRGEDVKKMSRMRRTISQRLVHAKNSTAMLTTFNEVDMQPVMDIRRRYKEVFKENHAIGLGFMSFFTKAVCHALQEFPAVNAYLNADDSTVTYHDYCDISIAVSTPKGLVVPVIRNAESLSMWEIEQEVKRLAIAGRDGTLSLDEMDGGTFSLTNGGVFGSLMSTPILNPPQSAILGMHKIEERPVVVDGEIVVRPMMYVALSYDHRIIDGKESVSFLVTVKDYLENPEKLLLGGDPVEMLLGL